MPTQTCSREQELTVRILLVNIQTQSGPEITDRVLTIREQFAVGQQHDPDEQRQHVGQRVGVSQVSGRKDSYVTPAVLWKGSS